jgi:hypothetical protein
LIDRQVKFFGLLEWVEGSVPQLRQEYPIEGIEGLILHHFYRASDRRRDPSRPKTGDAER